MEIVVVLELQRISRPDLSDAFSRRSSMVIDGDLSLPSIDESTSNSPEAELMNNNQL